MPSIAEQAETASMQGRDKAAVDLARAAGQAGEPRGWALLGYWHLAGRHVPRDLVRAREFMGLAAAGGDSDAALTEATLLANGTGGPVRWKEAIDRLKKTARENGGEAALHLALIEAMALDAEGYPANPKQYRDFANLSCEPDIRLFRNFLSFEERAHIAAAVQDILEPSMVVDPKSGKFMRHPIRDSLAAPIGPTRETLPIQAILRRIACATGTKTNHGESLTVLRYAPGQQYREHLDVLPHAKNQRGWTMILYLNDGYGGGKTVFPKIGLEVSARAGDAVMFGNLTANGEPDQRASHAGQPVSSGAKWIATRWIRVAPFDIWSPTA